MGETRERCAVCDFPLATGDDFDGEDNGALCWSAIGGTAHRGPRIDWRARALEAEKEREGMRERARHAEAQRDEAVSLAHESLEESVRAKRSAHFAEARVEALEAECIHYRSALAVLASDYPLPDGKTEPEYGEAAQRVACSALSATPPKPAPRPDATEALRVAREALETLRGREVVVARCDTTEVEDVVPDADEAARIIDTALELLRAHVEPTPLENAVLAHTEKETTP